MNPKSQVTVLVFTSNSALQLEDCLKSVHGWTDDIMVIDRGSRDQTLQIAERYADQVLSRSTGTEAERRQWALDQAKNAWVLFLEAEERITQELEGEIRQALLDEQGEVNGFLMPRVNYLGGTRVRFGTPFVREKMCLVRKDAVTFHSAAEGCRMAVRGLIRRLSNDIIYYCGKDFEDYLTILARRSEARAQDWISRRVTMTFSRALFVSIGRFFHSFIGKQGFRDRFLGFSLALTQSLSHILSYAKYWEMRRAERHA